MEYKIINLRKKPLPDGYMPTITTYLLDSVNSYCLRPAIIIFPGGGYQRCSYTEAERIAIGYNAAGFNSFVVDYTLAPNRHPEQISDAAAAVKLVRENAQEWGIDPDKIAVVGFSAGGHLAASISVLWDNTELFSKEDIEKGLHKPNASILSYPVITTGEFAALGYSFDNLLGENNKGEMRDFMSLEKQVKETTPPAFLWHTFEDETVPVENSFLYAQALSKYNIPCEMHIYPQGGHGLSLVSHETFWSVPRFRRKYDWLNQSVEWLIDLFKLN